MNDPIINNALYKSTFVYLLFEKEAKIFSKKVWKPLKFMKKMAQ
jgi:hypothetical protein